MSLRTTGSFLVFLLVTGAALSQSEVPPPQLPPEIVSLLDGILASGPDPRDRADELWVAMADRTGTIEPLLKEIERRVKETTSPPERLPAVRLASRLLRREGDLRSARGMLERIPENDRTVKDILAQAEVADALGLDEAVPLYDRLLEHTLDDVLRNRILLRKALMTGREGDGPPPLAQFAAVEGRDIDLRNQAAVILALLGEQKEAIKLFEPKGEGSERFREEVRRTEWALEAEAYKDAQEFGWSAVKAATLKRDRRYALTILVEAYRRDDALDTLIQRFATTPDLDEESRQMWIDLLRETGNVEEALRLFRESSQGNFTVDMRRQLLEMCRETGKEQVLVEAYTHLVQSEPRFIEWREGLSRYHLERGARQEGIAVWDGYVQSVPDVSYRMAAAASLSKLSLDDLAIEFARSCMDAGARERENALLFVFELERDRGDLNAAKQVLDELDKVAGATSPIRLDLADAYARIGDKRRATEVLEQLKAAKGSDRSPDAEMKLGFLYSEIGEEEKAQALWMDLWGTIDSIPRRMYVEERLMTVASRLGTLARIAVDLESKLADGKADDREAGLLVRLYSRVNDAVSATEVIQEHMRQSGKKPAEVLQEKSRIFLACNDYYNYEKTIKELLEIDPEGRGDYLRQLAMSNLERGQRAEARAVLTQLKSEETETDAEEFEAGVLAIAGMREEAMAAYRKGLARNPERIDTYLLLSNIMNEVGRHDQSAGMFQHLAATAERDDLFTIAIDGILNLRDGRQNLGAPDRVVEWARRLVFERLAPRADKVYLYQLVADLSDELKDQSMAIRALKAALPGSGERRTPLLRELMSMAKPQRGSSGISVVYVMGPGGPVGHVQNNAPGDSSRDELLMFGRRLLGQGEVVPPSVYMELGQAFLAAGEVVNASRTFNAASQLPEFDELQREIAEAFETARYPKEALRVYERMLMTRTNDVQLLARVGQLHEQMGRDDLAHDLYRRGLDLLISRLPLSKTLKQEDPEAKEEEMYWRPRNVSDDQQIYPTLYQGLTTTLPEGDACDAYLAEVGRSMDTDLAQVAAMETPQKLEGLPRIELRAQLFRQLAFAFGRVEAADALDRRILLALPTDEKILEELVRFRLGWGYRKSARDLIDAAGRPARQTMRLRLLAGANVRADLPGQVPLGEASSLIVPMLVSGEHETARVLLDRLDLSTGAKEDLDHLQTLVGASVFLGQKETTLTLLRHWLSMTITHGKGAALYSPVEQVLRWGRGYLPPEAQKSLVESLVQKVVEDPDRFTVFIRRLPELRQSVGADFISTDQVEELIRSVLAASDGFVYGIPPLFTFIPPAERGASLRGIWNRVPKTGRAQLVAMLVPVIGAEADESLTQFLVAAFSEGLKDADEKSHLIYQIDDLLNPDTEVRNLPLVLGVLEALRKADGDKPMYQAGCAICLEAMGRTEEALAEARKAWGALIDAPSSDWQATQTSYLLLNVFRKDHRDVLLGVIDEKESRAGKTPDLTRRRLELQRDPSDPSAYREALRAATELHPQDVSFLQQWRNECLQAGLLVEVVDTQRRILLSDPKSVNHRRILENDLRALHEYQAALQVRIEGLPDEKAGKENESVHKQPPAPPPSPLLIKEAVEGDDMEAAQTQFRRLWRGFSSGARGNAMSMIRISSLGQTFGAGFRTWVWPEERQVAPVAVVRRARGGWPEAMDQPLPVTTPKAAQPVKRRTVYEALSGFPFGQSEMRRQLRTLGPGGAHNEGLVSALLDQRIQQDGREATLGNLLAQAREGRAGRIEYAQIFALLENTPEGEREELGPILQELLDNLDTKDTNQLRRLARLAAKTGQGNLAAMLWQWCSTGRGAGYVDQALLNEVVEALDGEERDRVVTAILAGSRPPDNYYWQRDAYDVAVLRTWTQILGPSGALAKVRPIIDEIHDSTSYPRRAAASLAAELLARAGEIEAALDCLEIAVCKLDPPTDLQHAWLRSSWTTAAGIGDHDLRRLFPKDTEGWADAGAWFEGVADRLSTWLAADRVHRSTVFRALAVLTVRLHESGREALARKQLDQVDDLAGESADALLWRIDIRRRLGLTEEADLFERRLLTQRRLHPERVPEVLQRILTTEGPKAALDLADTALSLGRHPDLLELLAQAADLSEDPSLAAFWRTTAAAEAAADTALRMREIETATDG